MSNLRQRYLRGELGDDAPADWLVLFDAWFEQARTDPATVEPNAMQLATAAADGRPSVRTVLAREVTADGVVFYTGYDSAKGHDLAENPRASVVFAWLAQQRQVRISGPCEPVSRAQTQDYFDSRPRGSRLSAWASPQSSPVPDRRWLDQAEADVQRRFDGVDAIPAPPRWGGFRLRPEEVEFWQGRDNRLHDRIRYRRIEPNGWMRERLAP